MQRGPASLAGHRHSGAGGWGGYVQSFPWVKAWVGGEQRAAAEVSPVGLCPTNMLPASLQ